MKKPLEALSLEEQTYLQAYRQQVKSGFYPVQMICVDACVFWDNFVLLIRRKYLPGKGMLALPGGFVGVKERLFDAAVRECQEETGLRLDPSWCFGSQYFDDPERSHRGRILTHVFGFQVPTSENPPILHPADDASEARWFSLEMDDKSLFHDDHRDIVDEMIILYKEQLKKEKKS